MIKHEVTCDLKQVEKATKVTNITSLQKNLKKLLNLKKYEVKMGKGKRTEPTRPKKKQPHKHKKRTTKHY